MKTREEMQESVRDAVLTALDSVMQEATGAERAGWKDHDLPQLFKALDQHAYTLFLRQADHKGGYYL